MLGTGAGGMGGNAGTGMGSEAGAAGGGGTGGGEAGTGGVAGTQGGIAGRGGASGSGGTVGTGGQAGHVSGSGGSTSSPCGSGSGNVFCEDFENATLGSPWEIYTANPGCMDQSTGVGQRDTTHSHSGVASFHASVNYKGINSCWAELRRPVTVPTPDVFVRAFVYLSPASLKSPVMSYEMSMLYKAKGGFGAIGPTINGGALGFEGYGDFNPGRGQDSMAFPSDTWVCLEWQLHQGTSSTFTAWRDGVQAIAPTAVSVASSSEPLDAIFFGIYGYNNAGALVDVWLDDVALSATRIGCGAP
jgi:hypothetical protein